MKTNELYEVWQNARESQGYAHPSAIAAGAAYHAAMRALPECDDDGSRKFEWAAATAER